VAYGEWETRRIPPWIAWATIATLVVVIVVLLVA